MPQLERGGVRVAWDVVGQGPPVLLGHSLFCTTGMWDPVLERLKSRFRFYNINLRGHGRSTAPSPFTLDDVVGDWLAVMHAEGLERAAVVGLSTGAMTGMRLAVRAPERVTALVLMDTDDGPEKPGFRRKYTALGWWYFATGIVPRRPFLRGMLCDDSIRHRPELVASLLSDLRSFDNRELRYAMAAVFGRSGCDVGPITAPTLVMLGEHDRATPLRQHQAMAAAIAGARLEVVPEAGHLCTLEQPDSVAAVLGAFLDEHTAERHAATDSPKASG